jgi:hypothetical protein
MHLINICVKNQQMLQLLIQFINYVHVSALLCLVTWCAHHVHNILSTAPQISISQKALGMLPEDGNVMPKHVGATIT